MYVYSFNGNYVPFEGTPCVLLFNMSLACDVIFKCKPLQLFLVAY